MSIDLTPFKKTDAIDIQNLFNHKEIIGYLGGFTMLEQVKQQIKPHGISGWLAREGVETIGAFEIGGKPQSHIMKFGKVGVIPSWRRKRISTTLYAACVMQGILEGRRLFEDSIVGDSPWQNLALPSMGMTKAGTFKHKTGSAKDIIIYQYDLIEADFEYFLARINSDAKIYLHSQAYQKDLLEKNNIIMAKYVPDLIPKIEKLRQIILNHPQIVIMAPEEIRGVKNEKQTELIAIEENSHV